MATRSLLFERNIQNALNFKINKRFKTTNTLRSKEKQIETPIIVIREEDQVEVIGPPDECSNLRPIFRKRLLNETALQTKLREIQNDTQAWNQRFWTKHNKKFVKEKEHFIKILQQGDNEKQITADEMSEFYKRFLNENWKTHVAYNKEWYIRNLTILIVSISASFEKKMGGLVAQFK